MNKKFKFWCKGAPLFREGWYSQDHPMLAKHYGLDIFDSLHFEVYQSTGTTDRDGVEIWEGDILEYQSGETYEKKGVVILEKGAFVFDAIKNMKGFTALHSFSEDLSGGLRVLKVIGNKFDNPELLKQCVNWGKTVNIAQ